MQTKFMSIPSCLNQRTPKGFSVLEGLIALAIISIVIFATYSSYYRLESSSKRLARNNICELHNKKIFSVIGSKRLDASVDQDFISPAINSSYVSPFTASGPPLFSVPVPPAINAAAAAALKARFEDFPAAGDMKLYNLRGSYTLPTTTLTILNNGIESRMPLLSNTHMGLLADMYNNGFKNAYQDLPQALSPSFEVSGSNPAMSSFNQKYKAATKIQLSLYQIANKVVVGNLDPYFPMPASQYPEQVGGNGPVTKFFPYSKNEVIMAQFPSWMRADLGIRVNLRTEVTDLITNAAIQTCDNYSDYEYPNKIQNIIDFGDFDAIKYNGMGAPGTATNFNPANLRVTTAEVSSKAQIPGISDSHPLAPIFTNYNIDPALGRERNKCSQAGQIISNFYIKFRIKNLANDPGAIPICIDNSVQWLASEKINGWCPDGVGNFAKQSEVKINYDWQTSGGGWKPCENLKFCNQEPDKVVVVDVGDANRTLEYQYHYTVSVDNNSAAQNRLWGCELKYMAATVDVAGNLSYPSNPRPNFGTNPLTLASLASGLYPEPIKEIAPKVFFKPPPCYMCSCKKCKKKWGGFLGAIFAILIFIVLVIATGGAALYLLPYLAGSLGVLALMCGAGNLGCSSSNSGTTAVSSPVGNQFTSCADNLPFTNCKCGARCNKVKMPGPVWVDSVEGNSTAAIANNLQNQMCAVGSIPRVLGPENTTVNMTLTYKTEIPAGQVASLPAGMYSKVENSATAYYAMKSLDENGVLQDKVVQNQDEVVWQEFNRNTGVYCVSVNKCQAGTWVKSTQQYENTGPGPAMLTGPQEGCFKVKAAHNIDWAPNLSSYTQDKPAAKLPAACLEVDYTPGVFNEYGAMLKGYADLTHECAEVLPANLVSPFPFPKPNFNDNTKRFVGTASLTAPAEETTFENASNVSQTITLAAAIGISDNAMCAGSGGGSGYLKTPYKLDKKNLFMSLLVNRCEAAPEDFTSNGCDSLQNWTKCEPPINMPTGPASGTEQRYYETYTQAHRDLKFCTMERTNFDIIR